MKMSPQGQVARLPHSLTLLRSRRSVLAASRELWGVEAEKKKAKPHTRNYSYRLDCAHTRGRERGRTLWQRRQRDIFSTPTHHLFPPWTSEHSSASVLTFPSTFCRSYFSVPGPVRESCGREAHRQDSAPAQASILIGKESRRHHDTLYTSSLQQLLSPSRFR